VERDRLTITLRRDLLRHIDRLIDGTKVRNRSHAIEYLLTKALTPKIIRAVILAGGEGVKLRPLTYEIPKPMIPVHSRPLMEYTVTLLKESGVEKILIAMGEKDSTIREHFGNGDRFGIEILYSEETEPLGTAGPLREAKNFIKQEPFYLIYGDILAEIELEDMYQFHRRHQSLATMALTSVMESPEYGIVKLAGERVSGFTSKIESEEQTKARLTNAGIYIFEPEILEMIPKDSASMIEDLFPLLIQQKELYGYAFSGQWFDISTHREYERAIKEWCTD